MIPPGKVADFYMGFELPWWWYTVGTWMHSSISYRTSLSVRETTMLAPLGVVRNFLCSASRDNATLCIKCFYFLKPALNSASRSSQLLKAAAWPCHAWSLMIMLRNHNLFLNLGLNSFVFLRCGWTGACPEEKTWAGGLSGVRRVPENPECQIQAHECPERGMASIQPRLIA